MEKRGESRILRLKLVMLKHKALSFLIILLLTVLFVRLMVFVYDPNPRMFDFELHHFDYGLALLILSSVLLVFDPKRYFVYLISTAISLGLVLDQYWYIRGYPHGQGIISIHYVSTWRSGIITVSLFVLIFILVYFWINFKKR